MSRVDLTHTFTVPATIEETWAAFNDIESVAECFPGATVTSVEGEEFKGSCKVKLGPISLVYTGSGKFLEKDESDHRFVIEAKGKDKRGNGTAGATVTAVLNSAGGSSTDVEVRTDLSITGKPAQFGRGVIQDVSDKLLQQFATCLEQKVGAPSADTGAAAPGDGSTTRPSGEEAPVGEAADASGDDQAAGLSATAGIGATARKAPATTYSGASAGEAPGGGSESPVGSGRGSDEALDRGATGLPILLRSYWKPLAGGLLALLVLWRLLRRR